MDTDRIETALERIATALESLVRQAGEPPPGATRARGCANGHTHDGGTVGPDGRRQANTTLESFLGSRGIRIKVVPAEDPADSVIDSLSLFLGERYGALSSLLLQIKRAMQTGDRITESLQGRPQQDVSSACQFCNRLFEHAFLEEYRYSPSPVYLIKAKTTTLPRAQRFFGGQWLERFVLQKVRTVHRQLLSEVTGRPAFEHIINPQVILPNGDDFEFDVLAAMGPHVYWIEAKSGDYQKHVAKYGRIARILGLDVRHAFMVLTDVPADRCDALSVLFSMTVCNLETFEDRLLAVARADAARALPVGEALGNSPAGNEVAMSSEDRAALVTPKGCQGSLH